MTTDQLRAFSFGGGVQSTAALVLAAEGAIDYPLFIFANVGADSENPATLTYLEEYAWPYAERYGIELVEVQKTLRDGTLDTIVSAIDRRPSGYVPIPVRGVSGAPMRRACTSSFKIEVIDKELQRRGASETSPATVGLGISMDEWQRMTQSRYPYKVNEYPLIDRRLTRQDCRNIIENVGLPIPPKSSCFFCPFHDLVTWRRLKNDSPDLFAQAQSLEDRINERRKARGLTVVWLTRANAPLSQAVGDHDQLELFDEGGCDIAGYCHV